MSDIAYSVRTELARYLAREISLRKFVERFLLLSWTMDVDEERAAGDLVHEIELRLAEHSNGHWTEDELRERLSRLLETYSVVLALQPRRAAIETASSSASPATLWSVAVRAPMRITPELMKTW